MVLWRSGRYLENAAIGLKSDHGIGRTGSRKSILRPAAKVQCPDVLMFHEPTKGSAREAWLRVPWGIDVVRDALREYCLFCAPNLLRSSKLDLQFDLIWIPAFMEPSMKPQALIIREDSRSKPRLLLTASLKSIDFASLKLPPMVFP